MATPYITNRAHLEQVLGTAIVAQAVQVLGLADVQPVIDAQNALADGYVGKQVPLPPTAEAAAQVAPVVAELVLCALYVNNPSEVWQRRRDNAMRTLRDISTGAFKLHVPPVVDNPATPEDESSAAACGSSSRLIAGVLRYRSCTEADW